MSSPILPLPSYEPAKRQNVSNMRKQGAEVKNLCQQAIESVKTAKKDVSIPKANLKRPSDGTNPLNTKKMIKQMKGTPEFWAPKAEVQIPQDLAAAAPELKRACLKDFKEAQRQLENSIAEIALTHPDVAAFVKEFDERIFLLMRAYAEVLLDEENKVTSTAGTCNEAQSY